MSVTPIKDGDEDKQGNAVCPQCGERVLVDNYWGNPLRCPKCDVPYQLEAPPVKFT